MSSDVSRIPTTRVKLTGGENYAQWATEIERYANMMDAEELLMPEKADELNESQLTGEKKKLNARLAAIIYTNCDDGPAAIISTYKLSAKMWAALKERFENKTSTNLSTLLGIAFRMFHSQQNETFNDHVQAFDQHWNVLVSTTASAKSNTDDEKVKNFVSSNTLKLAIFLNTLPRSFSNIVEVIRTDTNISYAEAITRITNAKITANQRMWNKQTGTENPPNTAMATNTKPPPRVIKKCDYCKTHRGWSGIGHTEAECRNKTADEEKHVSLAECDSAEAHEWAFETYIELEGGDIEQNLEIEAYNTGEPTFVCDKWLLDSGASQHMTPYSTDLTNLKPFKEKVKVANGEYLMSTYVGEARIFLPESRIVISNTLVVPGLTRRLTSVKQLNIKGLTVTFGPSTTTLFLGPKFIGTWWNKIRPSQTQLEALPLSVTPSSTSANLTVDEAHRKYGHASYSLVSRLQEVLPASRPQANCEQCMKGKMRRPNNPPASIHTSRPLELLHADLCGPFRTTGLGGEQYWLMVVDDFSRMTAIIPMKSKDQTEEKLPQVITAWENITRQKCVALRTDDGGEFRSRYLNRLLADRGIQHQLSVPGVHQTNAVAERANQSAEQSCRTLLITHPKYLWPEAAQYCAYVRNRLPHAAHGQAPIERFLGKNAYEERQRIKEFGERVIGFNHRITDKLSPHSIEGMIVGFAPQHNIYRVYIGNKRVILMKDPKVLASSAVQNTAPVWPENDHPASPKIEEIESSDSTGHKSVVQNETNSSSILAEQQQQPNTLQLPGAMPQSPLNEQQLSLRRSQRTTKGKLPSRYTDQIYLAESEAESCVLFSESIAYEDTPTHAQALSGKNKKEWEKAIAAEKAQLIKYDVYEEVACDDPQAAEYRTLDAKWVHKIKRDEKGNIIKFKSRLTARGFTQVEGIDFLETETCMARAASHRLVLALAISENWEIQKWDIEGAYLTAPIEEKLAIRDPQITEGKAWLLKKSIYGTKQAGRNFEEYRNTAAATAGLIPNPEDRGILYNENTIATTHVDDMLICAPKKEHLDIVRRKMGEYFSITNAGRPRQWLGMELTWNSTASEVTLTQARLLEQLASTIGINTGKPIPLSPGYILGDGEILESNLKRSYQRILGTLMFIATSTRPDISYAVGALGQQTANPTSTDLKHLTGVFQYAYGTKNEGIKIGGLWDSHIRSFADAAFPGPKEHRRGQTGWIVTLGHNIIAWKSTKQKSICLSTAEAEFMAATSSAQEAL